jgi:predicted ABC-type ATPase
MARLRMIAGPNGSGKTTLTKFLQQNFHLSFGYYINADDIETILRKNNKISFRRFGIKADAEKFSKFFEKHPLATECNEVKFYIKRNSFYLESIRNNFSYFAALFADFLRQEIIQTNQTFSFETVMSGKDKIELLQNARQRGYRIYLYYICTDDVIINKDRVSNRIGKGGHPVPEEKVEQRYYRSLEQLLDAIKLSDRTYLFDNSGTEHKLVAEITNGKDIQFDPAFIPNWFDKYVLEKLNL